MRKFLFILLFFIPFFAQAQLDDILKKTVPVPDLLEEKNVTTSITDAYPEAFWLNELGDYIDPVEMTDYSFDLKPGYYRYTLQTYCLKAGSHSPTKGSGYMVAPLLGKRSDLVTNILKRSADHPEIEQHDIQVLIWSIIYNQKFTDLEPQLQFRVRPLLTEAEIADLSIGVKDVAYDLLPEGAKQTAKLYKDLRTKMSDPSMSYRDLEQIAMVPGSPPGDLLYKNIDLGGWAYSGDGFYMRIMPESYPRSVVEVYRPAMINIRRDSQNRIIQMENEGNKIELSYQDEPGSDILFAEGKAYPIFRFKGIKLTGANPGEEYSIENTGWMIRGDGKELKNVTEYKNYSQDPSLTEYKSRLSEYKDYSKSLEKYKKAYSKAPTKGSQKDISDFDADKHMHDGLKKAMNPTDFKGKSNWMRKHFGHVMDWWDNANNSLNPSDNGPKHFSPEKFGGAPANTGNQRIGVSRRGAM